MFVPDELWGEVLKLYHDAPSAGHFGFVKTLHLLERVLVARLQKRRFPICFHLLDLPDGQESRGEVPWTIEADPHPYQALVGYHHGLYY